MASLESMLPRPTPAQRAWQEAEFGLVYHYDLHLFDGIRYNQRQNRLTRFNDPAIFTPADLDTDQWIDAAAACGARFAIITASHETGFRLWQSDANPFCLKATSWGGGRRDIVGEFVTSCRRAGIRPGVYMGARWNGRLGVWDFRTTERSPLTQAAYNALIEAEVTEICTRYGPLFEMWFDGGILAPNDGGPDVLPIVEEHQPDCLFYHSNQRRDARWSGTESGTVGDPCWSTIDVEHMRTGRDRAEAVRDYLRHGDPDGRHWCPAMADAPLRNHEWFWEPGDDHKLYEADDLLRMHMQSVGRNGTLILGATPDVRGRIPDTDMHVLQRFGRALRARFSRRLGMCGGTGMVLELALPDASRVSHVAVSEDIQHGERVRAYTLEGQVPQGTWVALAAGTCIGHKRVHALEGPVLTALRLHVTGAVAPPQIEQFAAYA